MAKKNNRKKSYKLELKRAGIIKTAGAEVAKTVKEATKIVGNEVKKASKSFDSFVSELSGVAQARLETFYAEGIQSAKDFANWTEKELLSLKGIGPATIKQLKELGVKFKD